MTHLKARKVIETHRAIWERYKKIAPAKTSRSRRSSDSDVSEEKQNPQYELDLGF